MSLQKIEELVKRTILTKTEKIIAEYLLDNYATVGFMTSTDIAVALGVSNSSVIKLSRSLGYRGFNDLKNEIKASMSEQLRSANESEYSNYTPIDRFAHNIDNLSSGETMSKQLNWSILGIKEAYNKNPMHKITACVDILKSSRKKYIVGFRSTSFVASFFAFELLFMLPEIVVNTDADSRAVEKMVDISAEDCIILFTYPRYSKMNLIIKKIAEDAGARIIAITDKMTSPVATGADIVLLCNPISLSYHNSIIPMLFVCELLITELTKGTLNEDQVKLKFISKYIDPEALY